MSRIRARAARLTARKSALVVVGVVVGALFVPQGAAFAVKTMQQVIVANGTDNPVPVEGSVNAVVEGNIDGEPVKTQAVGTEKVQIDGTPEVKLEGTPTVKSAGPAERFSVSGLLSDVSKGGGGLSMSYEVPSGKDLIVTFATARMIDTAAKNTPFDLEVGEHFGAVADRATAYVPLTQMGGRRWAGSEQVEVVVEDRLKVAHGADGDTSTNPATVFTVSGYLVDE